MCIESPTENVVGLSDSMEAGVAHARRESL